MASPYISSQRPPMERMERPWMGMALLIAVPLLALILIRMLWSGSGLWFLTVGIILLGLAAVIFLARRPQEAEYGRPALAQESNRLPLVLTGLGVLFLAMLLLPNFAGGDDGPTVIQQPQSGALSEVSGASSAPTAQQPSQPAEQPAAQQPQAPAVAGDTYVVQEGDTLWDIAQRFGTTVDAIVAANILEDPADIAIGDELIIPGGDTAAGGATEEEEVPIEEPAPVE